MSKILIKLIILFFLIASISTAYAGLIYSKPEFRGRVIDAETKEPIEGAVVVALYYNYPLFSGPGGPSAYVFHAQETLTDEKGIFYIPSYSRLTLYFRDVDVDFIIFKPGYMSCYGPTHINTQLVEKYFSIDVIGKVAEIEDGSFEEGNYVKWKGPLGVVELKKGEKDPLMPTNYRSKELPLLFKALNDDRKNRGYMGEIK